jgi:hypothetical protein
MGIGTGHPLGLEEGPLTFDHSTSPRGRQRFRWSPPELCRISGSIVGS